MKKFELEKIPLEGIHLIEASAGTGKTYSIEGLYLRLIEKGLRPDEILVMTFTEAATAELRDRIRARLARRLAEIERENKPGNSALVRAAMLSFDTAAIFTIHGFCRRMLFEMAFETNSAFSLELTTDQSEIAADVTWDFFRMHIYSMPAEYLRHARLIPKSLMGLATKAGPDAEIIPAPDRPEIEAALAAYRESFKVLAKRWLEDAEVIRSILENAKGLDRRSYQKKTIDNAFSDMDAYVKAGSSTGVFERFKYFRHSYMIGSPKSPVRAPLHPFFEFCDGYAEQSEALMAAFGAMTIWLQREFVSYFRLKMPESKDILGIMHFDDLLLRMRISLASGSDGLAAAVRKKFRAALIDEFQDTDPVQWEIFGRLFSPGTMFLIGDPKQAIYGFRGADIFTYLDAKEKIPEENSHRLDMNYRSVKGLVEAVNTLFEKGPFGHDGIPYERVEPSDRKPETGLSGEPMRIWVMKGRSGDQITKGDAVRMAARSTASEAARLVNSGEVRPGQIAVLAREWRQANLVRDELVSRGLKCVITSNERVFQSEEALLMKMLLEAVADTSRDDLIRACLASKLFGMSAEDLLRLEEDDSMWDDIIAEFGMYRDLWQDEGFMLMFRDFYFRRGMPNLSLLPYAERRLTNMQHIAELLHSEETSGRTGMDSLLAWLGEKIASESRDDEAELRLESDGDAVKILTVHKSKGLQFPVVFLPFAWDEKEEAFAVFHEGSRRVIDLGSGRLAENRLKSAEENLQEGMRLLYVGLTRAIDRCYLFCGNINLSGNTAPSRLLGIGGLDGDGILEHLSKYESCWIKVEAMPEETEYADTGSAGIVKDLSCRIFPGRIDSGFSVMSYSSLTGSVLPDDRDIDFSDARRMVQPDDFSIFALPRGAATGNMIHEVMELVDFTGPDDGLIKGVMQRHGFGGQWFEAVAGMVGNLMSVPIDESSLLGDVAFSKRLSELEFFLPVTGLDSEKLKRLFKPGDDLQSIFSRLELKPSRGFIRGFIDLVFEAGGKYYLLDWKSNYLGAQTDDYDQASMKSEMVNEYYVLQYHMYTLGLHRYLSSRVNGYSFEKHFGGVLYLFARGVDSEKGTGIYRARPDLNTIDNLAAGLLGGTGI